MTSDLPASMLRPVDLDSDEQRLNENNPRYQTTHYVPMREHRQRLAEREIQVRVDVAVEIAAAIRTVLESSKAANYIAALARAEKIALAHRVPRGGTVIEGSGMAVEPKKMDTILSLRLDSELAGALRDLATRRGCAISDLLREGVEIVLRTGGEVFRPDEPVGQVRVGAGQCGTSPEGEATRKAEPNERHQQRASDLHQRRPAGARQVE